MWFCDSIARRIGLGLLEPPEDWVGTLPQELLKRDLWVGTVADINRVADRSFVKPANDKVFQYGVYEHWSDVPVRYVAQHCPIIVSEVVAFDLEVRLYVMDQAVVTASQYRLYREGVDEDQAVEQAIQFITPHLASFRLPSAVVIDVGHIEDRGWAVIEANQVYASGLYYQADARKVLPLLLRAAGPRALVRASDEAYLRRLS
jgi:hypothetical protein